MNWRRVLVWLLAAGAAVLSFDALRAYALGAPPLAGGVIPERTIIDRDWLAALWAVEVDLAAAVGILGIRANRRDPLAWATFVLAAVASVGFQVFSLPAVAARAVPPMALFLAIVVLELPRPAARPAWDPTPPPPPEEEPEEEPAQPDPEDRPRVRPNGAQFTAAQLTQIQGWVAQGRTNRSQMARDLGLTSDRKRKELGRLVTQLVAQGDPARNGSPGGGS